LLPLDRKSEAKPKERKWLAWSTTGISRLPHL
jgi:hypothetical protein